MKVFISWSGDVSKKVGEAFKNWIPHVLQTVEPYYTPTDIEKGTRWAHDIAAELELCQAGIFCVTRDNLNSQWLMFEAGAISKQVDGSLVCPVLIDLPATDLAGPLTQFQVTPFQKEEIKKLIQTLNKGNPGTVLSDAHLDHAFELNWPALEKQIEEIRNAATPNDDAQPRRNEREVMFEILELTRALAIQKTGGFKNHNELNSLISNFLLSFNAVFETDWEHSKICLEEGNHFIDPTGTFVNPKVLDETNNWANRAVLLTSYRKLVDYIKSHEIDITTSY